MKTRCYPKLNLALDILGKHETEDMHELQTVFYEYKEIWDDVSVHEVKGNGISIECSGNDEVPCNHKNSCYKAAKLMQELAKKDCGLHIEIKKNIPVASGLGGGSSNAAAVIKLLNQMWELNWDDEKLAKIAADIGMDVPFFIYGGTCLGTHFGEVIEQLPDLPELNIKAQWAKLPSSTKEAFKFIDLKKCGQDKNKTEAMIKAIKIGDCDAVIANIHNDFDQLLEKEGRFFKHHKHNFAKDSARIRAKFKDQGAKVTCLTGSGSAVIAGF